MFSRMMVLIGCMMPLPALALFCPTSTRYIELGATVDAVVKTCGKPASIKKQDDSYVISADWIYYTSETKDEYVKLVFKDRYIQSLAAEKVCPKKIPGCMPSSVTIYRYNGCLPASVAAGNSMMYVKYHCGEPDKVIVKDADMNVTQEYYYKDATGNSTLIFRNGILVDSK